MVSLELKKLKVNSFSSNKTKLEYPKYKSIEIKSLIKLETPAPSS
jgi:hypothetical protein